MLDLLAPGGMLRKSWKKQFVGRKNLLSRRKTKRSIDEKPPNPVGTVEENRKIVGALNFLAPEGMLKKS